MSTIKEALAAADQFIVPYIEAAPGIADEDIIAACVTSFVPGEFDDFDADQAAEAVAVTEQRILQVIWQHKQNTQQWSVHRLPLKSIIRATVNKHVNNSRIDQLSIECWTTTDEKSILFELPKDAEVLRLYGSRKALGEAFTKLVDEIARRV